VLKTRGDGIFELLTIKPSCQNSPKRRNQHDSRYFFCFGKRGLVAALFVFHLVGSYTCYNYENKQWRESEISILSLCRLPLGAYEKKSGT